MTAARRISLLLLLAGLALGTFSDRAPQNPVVYLGGYRVLAADFHIHSFPLSWASLGPFDTVEQARREGLDVIAMTPHNLLWVGQLGRKYAQWTGAPLVISGEEIVSPQYHLLAIGIQRTVSWREPVASAIDAIHAQGGVAIAAHPIRAFWPAYDAAAVRKLDGTEVLHPLAYQNGPGYAELQEFYARANVTAIGDSDFHGLEHIGICRTLVFVREATEAGVLEAIRARRTVVVDRDGYAYGDPQLIPLVRASSECRRLLDSPAITSAATPLAHWSRILGLLGIAGMLLFGFSSHTRDPRRRSR
jgi:predicted metal-dependent phosphoesterase TrpH